MNDDISDAVKYGDFEVFRGENYEALLPELKLEGFDSDFDNFLSEMVVSDFDITLTQQAFADLKKSDDPGLPAPETPTSTRFAKLSDDEIKGFQELTQSKATKQSTKWGLKILTGTLLFFKKVNISKQQLNANKNSPYYAVTVFSQITVKTWISLCVFYYRLAY